MGLMRRVGEPSLGLLLTSYFLQLGGSLCSQDQTIYENKMWLTKVQAQLHTNLSETLPEGGRVIVLVTESVDSSSAA